MEIKERKCKECEQTKPLYCFRIAQRSSIGYRNARCKDCLSHLQDKITYPILKQPSREWVLSELQRLKSIKHVKPTEL